VIGFSTCPTSRKSITFTGSLRVALHPSNSSAEKSGISARVFNDHSYRLGLNAPLASKR